VVDFFAGGSLLTSGEAKGIAHDANSTNEVKLMSNSDEKSLYERLGGYDAVSAVANYRENQPGNSCGDDRNDAVAREFFHEQI
jgi:hypothetical protein